MKALYLLALCGAVTACATTETTSGQSAAATPASASAAAPAPAPKADAAKKKLVCTNERDDEISSRIAVRRVCRPATTKEPKAGK